MQHCSVFDNPGYFSDPGHGEPDHIYKTTVLLREKAVHSGWQIWLGWTLMAGI